MLGYCIKQGFQNFIKNPLFSFASVVTVSACIFLFCMFMAMAANLESALKEAETNVGITVFFEEGAGQQTKDDIRSEILAFGGVEEVRYTGAEEAWKEFQASYFGDRAEELTAAFDGENPLASSDSYEVFMEDINQQPAMVSMLRQLPGVREVNYASSAVTLLKKLNSGIYLLSIVIIGLLFFVSVFLISNTINVTAVFRRKENEIMKLIGARDYLIRAPFVVEGLMIGVLGSVIPLFSVNFLYTRLASWLEAQAAAMTSSTVLKNFMTLIPRAELRPMMLISALVLGVGMSVIVSFLAINRHLRTMR